MGSSVEVLFIFHHQIDGQTRQACLHLVVQEEVRVEEVRQEMRHGIPFGIQRDRGRIRHAVGGKGARREGGRSHYGCASRTFSRNVSAAGSRRTTTRRGRLHGKSRGLKQCIGKMPVQNRVRGCRCPRPNLESRGSISARGVGVGSRPYFVENQLHPLHREIANRSTVYIKREFRIESLWVDVWVKRQ